MIILIFTLPTCCDFIQLSNNFSQLKQSKVFKRESSKDQVSPEYGSDTCESQHQMCRKCFGQFCLPADYNRLFRPTVNHNDKGVSPGPVDVDLDFDVRIFEVNDIKFTISFTMFFGVRWKEPRLVKKNSSDSNPVEQVSLEILEYLWLPSIYILNLKTYQTLDIFSDFAGTSLQYWVLLYIRK